MRTFWETVAEDTRWGRYLTGIERHAFVAAHAQAGIPGTVLEIGCEGGRWSQLLSQMGWEAICTNVDPAVLAMCQQRIPSARCVLVDPQATTLPCAGETLDLLLCVEMPPVMEGDWLGSEAQRTLRAGGLFVGVFFNRHAWRALAFRAREALKVRLGGDMSSVAVQQLLRAVEKKVTQSLIHGCLRTWMLLVSLPKKQQFSFHSHVRMDGATVRPSGPHPFQSVGYVYRTETEQKRKPVIMKREKIGILTFHRGRVSKEFGFVANLK